MSKAKNDQKKYIKYFTAHNIMLSCIYYNRSDESYFLGTGSGDIKKVMVIVTNSNFNNFFIPISKITYYKRSKETKEKPQVS